MKPSVSLPAGVQVPSVAVRFGFKGADAPALLQQVGLRIPALPNQVTHWQADEPFGSGRCLRQGNTEFLMELDHASPPKLQGNDAFPRAWELIRSDHSVLLDGAQWPRELNQVCSFDFERLRDAPDMVVMTLMAGISVTVIREPQSGLNTSTGMALRLWCDAGFSTYLHDCLRSIGESR